MAIVVDTTVVIACVMNEPHRGALLLATSGEELIAPGSMPWEIGNAFSAMFKRGRIDISKAVQALALLNQMPISLKSVDLESAIRLSERLRIYAYDAYMIQCALDATAELLSLDAGLTTAARAVGVAIREIKP